MFKKRKEKSNNEFMPNILNGLIQYMETQHKIEDEKKDQLNLDFQKWIESEKALIDLSGKMPYCSACEFAINNECVASQVNRLEGRLCSKACKKHIENIQHEKYKNFIFSKLDD